MQVLQCYWLAGEAIKWNRQVPVKQKDYLTQLFFGKNTNFSFRKNKTFRREYITQMKNKLFKNWIKNVIYKKKHCINEDWSKYSLKIRNFKKNSIEYLLSCVSSAAAKLKHTATTSQKHIWLGMTQKSII